MKTQCPDCHKEFDTAPVAEKESSKECCSALQEAASSTPGPEMAKDELTFSSRFSTVLLVAGVVLLVIALFCFFTSGGSLHSHGRYLRALSLSLAKTGAVSLFASCLLRVLISIARSLKNSGSSK